MEEKRGGSGMVKGISACLTGKVSGENIYVHVMLLTMEPVRALSITLRSCRCSSLQRKEIRSLDQSKRVLSPYVEFRWRRYVENANLG